MSTPTPETAFPLRNFVFEKLKAAFGEPNRTVGTDRHWAVKPMADRAAIHVLCNGKEDFPILWVFNPHHPSGEEGVQHVVIKEQSQVGPMIEGIQQQVKRAGAPR